MNINEIKVKNTNGNYSVFVGNNILNILPEKIRLVCPEAQKIALIIDKKIPKIFITRIKKKLKKYTLFFFEYNVNEKLKSFQNIGNLVEKCLFNKFNRNDIMISVGGGILGDFTAFSASITKRGINFINIPSTLLAQVDSSIGGKTGVNSKLGKNLIGTFYQPKLVISDISLLKSLPYREIVCGYAEILKHSLILKNDFFRWLKLNSKKILIDRDINIILTAVIKSCKVKLFFVNKDVHEKNIRMMLNFGHTFAHAIEVQNNYSKKINHGEAVIIGMMLATKLSYLKKVCDINTLNEIIEIFKKNKLKYELSSFFNKNEYSKIINHMSNDKKNNDKMINLILIKKIGYTTKPNKYKISSKEFKKLFFKII